MPFIYRKRAVPDHIDFLQTTRECDVPVPLAQCPDQSIAIYLLYQMSLYSLNSEWLLLILLYLSAVTMIKESKALR